MVLLNVTHDMVKISISLAHLAVSSMTDPHNNGSIIMLMA